MDLAVAFSMDSEEPFNTDWAEPSGMDSAVAFSTDSQASGT